MNWARGVENLGKLAAVLWASLGFVVVLGGLTYAQTQWTLNLILAVVFGMIGLALFAHNRATRSAVEVAPEHPDMKALIRAEALANLAALASGSVLLIAAIHRVLGEGRAVFG